MTGWRFWSARLKQFVAGILNDFFLDQNFVTLNTKLLTVFLKFTTAVYSLFINHARLFTITFYSPFINHRLLTMNKKFVVNKRLW